LQAALFLPVKKIGPRPFKIFEVVGMVYQAGNIGIFIINGDGEDNAPVHQKFLSGRYDDAGGEHLNSSPVIGL
jgi:hypothetical protein